MGDNKNSIDSASVAAVGFIAMILIGIVVFVMSQMKLNGFALAIGNVLIILLMIAIVVTIMSCIGIMFENYSDKEQHIANKNMFQAEYDEYTDKLGIVKSNVYVTMFDTDIYDLILPIPQYIWISDNCINLFPMAEYYKNYRTNSISRPNISELEQKLKSIPLDSILYYEEVGELRKYATVSGGGTSLKGALLGYIIAEDVGAIIGSREPITTNVVSEDDRRVELIYKNQEEQIENLEFKHDAYNVFKKLIPLKEFRRIVGLNTVQGIKDDVDIDIQEHQTVKEKLKQLKELYVEGLITEEDFIERKKKILEKI